MKLMIKRLNRWKLKTSPLVLTFSVLFGCSASEPSDQGKVIEEAAQNEPGAGGPDAPEEQVQAEPGILESSKKKIRNFKELYLSMAALTNIDPEREQIKDEFENRISASLPSGSNVEEFTPSQQVAVLKIAALFCKEAFEQPEPKKAIYAGIDLYEDPTYKFSTIRDQDKEAMANAIVTNILRLDEGEFKDQKVAELLTLHKELEQIVATKVGVDEEKPSDADLREILESTAIGACTAVLSSAGVSIY